jgi:hypothetical protein
MLFNVGARRSGTFWLQRVITAHPEISAIPSETYLFSHGIAPLFERFHHAARASPRVASLYADRESLLDATRDLCDAVLAPYLEPGSRYLAERTPWHVRFLSLIDQIYPDARVIHIVRDGRDVARSIAAQRWGPDNVAEAAEEWRSCIEAARAAHIPPARYHEVRYEQLLGKPVETIHSLFDWLDVSSDADVVAQAAAEARRERNVDTRGRPGVGSGKWRESWSPEELEAFVRVAGDLLEELGYEPSALAGGHPRRRAQSRGQRVRSALRQRVPRPRRAVAGAKSVATTGSSVGEPGYRLHVADRILEALLAGRVKDVEAVLGAAALVRVVSLEGIEEGRGRAGVELLERILAPEPFRGRQIRGEVHPGAPSIGYVLTIHPEGLPPVERIVFVTIEDREVTELCIYLPPLAGAPGASRGGTP